MRPFRGGLKLTAVLLFAAPGGLAAQTARADSLAAAAARALVADLRLAAPGRGGVPVCVTVQSDTAHAGSSALRAAFAAALRSVLAGLGPADSARVVDVQLDSVAPAADSGRAYVSYSSWVRRPGGSWGREDRVYSFRAAGAGWAAPRRTSLYFADGQVTAADAGPPACVGG